MDDDQETSDVIRPPSEVARRALALFVVFAAAVGADRNELRHWLVESGLDPEVTPLERMFLDNEHPSERETISKSWQSERLSVLLWALGLIPSLPASDEQCDTALFEILPPFGPISVDEFVAGAKLRPDAELWEMADECLKAHWIARNARLHNRPPTEPGDIEVIQERHYAINWVTGYDGGVPWDEVTADT